MPSTLSGARKVGRPLSEDHAYAEEMGCSHDVILRHGGAKRLKALPDSARELLLRPKGNAPKKWGLAARGMTVKKPFQVINEAEVEAQIRIILRLRGLSA